MRVIDQANRIPEAGMEGRVCVTGAGGFVASWLVKLLLSKGYVVHGTVRDPSDENNSNLQKLEKAKENLHIFKVDLLEYDSVVSAIAGCAGVFHVASPVPVSRVVDPEVELLSPAVTGTLNVLKACYSEKVKRVVVVSSVAAVLMNPSWTANMVINEDCWSDIEYCRTTENWYSLSKTLAESKALDYAKQNSLDVITLCASMVIGPLLQSTVNFSTLFLLNMLKGHESIENKTWNFVDVRDVAESLLLIYENPESSGRYICSSCGISIRDMVDILKSKYPNYDYPKEYTEDGDVVGHAGTLSSKKLKKLGWKCRPLEKSVTDSVENYIEAGILVENRNIKHSISASLSFHHNVTL